MRARSIRAAVMVLMCGVATGMSGQPGVRVETTAGVVQGTRLPGSAIRVFKGIPYASPPVGERRWQPPRPAEPWQGVRDATKFGAACLQGKIFGDINFSELSEDCLTLNIWTPARSAGDRLPVMVWIHGGGFQAGAGGEPRHDGEAFARKGIVLVTINYRLGVFGFFAHPDLTRESGRNASGNYGMLDQVAALRWVRDNAAAFGGDPGNVTIFGESAGSFAVSALMASPLAEGLFHKAIGQSGAFFSTGTLPIAPLPASEQQGTKFAAALGAGSLAALRAKPGADLLPVAVKTQPWFAPNLDGYFLAENVAGIYAAGRQTRVPLLAGWNADEIRSSVTLRKEKPTAQSFAAEVRKRFGDRAGAVLEVYPAATDAEALESAAALASDTFIGYSTWKWIETHLQSSRAPVYRYSFDRKIPVAPGETVMGMPATSRDIGARHAGEIEYVFGALSLSLPRVPWEPIDRRLSDAMTSYWANFARTGDPNGPGLPKWPRYEAGSRRVLHFDETIRDAPDTRRPRYEALDAIAAAQQAAGTVSPQPAADAGPRIPEGFTPIFNGKDLTGWHVSRTNHHGTTPDFRVVHGVIVGTQNPRGKGGILLTDKRYRNVEVYMEIKPDWGCDSGLFLRSNEAGEAYQVTLDYLPGGAMGGIYGERLAGVKGGGRKGAWQDAWKREQWNSVRARIEGDVPHITVWINDQLITDFTDTANHAAGGASDGMLAIQMHYTDEETPRWVDAGFWRWRVIAVKELPGR